jgi:O-methyltransferase
LLSLGVRFPNTWFEIDWTKDWNFDDDIFFHEPHFRNTFRRYFLSETAKFIDKLKIVGENIEFGVYFGYGSKIILENSIKRLHLVDSFMGLSEPSKSDGIEWNVGDMAVTEEIVKKNLESYSDRITIHNGWIPEVLTTIEIKNIALAHIDVDLYQPTFESLLFCQLKLSSGGLIICDDYGLSKCPGATKACDDFVKRFSDFTILPLPVGGALIFIR